MYGIQVKDPFTDLKAVGQSVQQGNPVGVVKNYFKSVPEMYALKLSAKPVGAIIGKTIGALANDVSLGIKLGKASTTAIRSTTGWYLKPFQKFAQVAKTRAGVTAKAAKASGLLAKTGGLALGIGIDHAYSRLHPTRVSIFDAVYTSLGGDPNDRQQKAIDSKFQFVPDVLMGGFAMKAVSKLSQFLGGNKDGKK